MECTSSRGGQNSQGKHQTLDPRANSHGAHSDTTQPSEGLRWFKNLVYIIRNLVIKQISDLLNW